MMNASERYTEVDGVRVVSVRHTGRNEANWDGGVTPPVT